jgi:hypothetical protein
MEVGYKQSAIEAYFRSLFPGCSIKSRWDFTKQNLMVRVDSPQGQIKHLVSLSAAFVDANAGSEIVQKLGKWNLRGYLKKSRKERVAVTNRGIQVTR